MPIARQRKPPGLLLPALSLAKRELVRFLRQRSRVVGALVQPLIFWLVIGSGLAPTFRVEGAAGVIGLVEAVVELAGDVELVALAADEALDEPLRPRVGLRFADDVVMGFVHQEDAEKVFRVLPKRFGKYGLTIHPDKTRLVAFGRPRGTPGKRPGTFDFLGFTHYWGKSRRGQWIVKSKTARQRLSRGL